MGEQSRGHTGTATASKKKSPTVSRQIPTVETSESDDNCGVRRPSLKSEYRPQIRDLVAEINMLPVVPIQDLNTLPNGEVSKLKMLAQDITAMGTRPPARATRQHTTPNTPDKKKKCKSKKSLGPTVSEADLA